MKVSRRKFLQGSAVAAGALGAHRFLFDRFDTLAAADDPLAAATSLEDVVPTTCWIGKQDCGMLAHRVDGRVIKFEGHPANPRNVGTLCPKGQAQIISLYDPNRVKAPLIRTNAKGQSGEWRQASWDEALGLTADRLNSVRAEDPKAVLWQKGRSKAKKFYDEAFVKSIGCEKLGHGAYCSDAGYRALEYTIGTHAVLHPDFRHCDYMLSWGWNITGAGGNKFCWLTWPRHMVEALDRGMKITHIDPRLRSAGPFANTWLPIRPGTDLALALAIQHELVARGFTDREYLRTYTNASFLVKEDGLFLRRNEAPLVWDEAARRAAPFEDAQEPSLEGSYEVDGEKVRPAFEVYKEHIAGYTSEWAASITGLSAEQIQRVATEFGTKARIGSTTVVEGVEIPLRPVGIMAYHMAQMELGFQAIRAMVMIPMLVGAIGAVGGQLSDFTWKIHKNYAAFENIEVADPPYSYTLKSSKYFPINSGLPGLVARAMQDPARYEVDRLPRAVLLHMVNPLAAFPSQAEFLDTYGRFEFVAVISPWLSETADFFADVVLPAATIEKYEGPIDATNQYVEATTLRVPPMEPLFESRGEIDIYLDLTERMGTLYGEGGYLDHINQQLGLEGEFSLPLDSKPTVEHIFDTWARSQGLEEGLNFFRTKGVLVKGPVAATKMYGYVFDPPFGGALHRLHGESLLTAQIQMRDKGADEIYWRDYTALPTWRDPTMEGSPPEYDLYLISYHMIEHKQSRTSFVPLLAELAPGSRLDINPDKARELGIADGDQVVVESHNALTGETRQLTTTAIYTEGIRPDVVGLPHHFGMWTHPQNEGQGPSPNEIYFTGEGYVTNTADQSFHVKVRVSKAGDLS